MSCSVLALFTAVSAFPNDFSVCIGNHTADRNIPVSFRLPGERKGKAHCLFMIHRQ